MTKHLKLKNTLNDLGKMNATTETNLTWLRQAVGELLASRKNKQTNKIINKYINISLYSRDVNKDLTPKDQDKDKDLTPRDQDKDKDLLDLTLQGQRQGPDPQGPGQGQGLEICP